MIELTPPKNPAKRRAWIKYRLAEAGLSFAELGRKNDLQRSTLLTVFYRPWPKGERIVARAVGCKPEQLWPDRYDASGKPNRVNRSKARRRRGTPKTVARRVSRGNNECSTEHPHE